MRHNKKSHESLVVDSTLYAYHKSLDQMIPQINSFARLTGLPVKMIMFTSKENIYPVLGKKNYPQYKINKIHQVQQLCIGELTRNYGKINKHILNGKFVLFNEKGSNIYILISHGDTSFFNDGLFRFVRANYPRWSMPFFYSWELEIMLSELAKAMPECKIMITKVSSKSRLNVALSRRKKETDITWTDKPFKEIFRHAKQNEEWIEKIHFDLLAKPQAPDTFGNNMLSGFISSDGVFKCELAFSVFYDVIIKKALELLYKRNTQLSNRARSIETEFESKPLYIEFDDAIFAEKAQNRRLINVLKSMPKMAYSVIHENPYLHMSVTDYIDNSSYDIWILSDCRITIAPQTVCSLSSLNRLCAHISREFQEGVIKDIIEV